MFDVSGLCILLVGVSLCKFFFASHECFRFYVPRVCLSLHVTDTLVRRATLG